MLMVESFPGPFWAPLLRDMLAIQMLRCYLVTCAMAVMRFPVRKSEQVSYVVGN